MRSADHSDQEGFVGFSGDENGAMLSSLQCLGPRIESEPIFRAGSCMAIEAPGFQQLEGTGR